MPPSFLFRLRGLFMRLRQRLFKPFSVGVRAIVTDPQGGILLVRHTYMQGWFLPGGGVDKREHLVDALARELREELGLIVTQQPALLGTYGNFHEGKSDFVSVFVVRDFRLEKSENPEIREWAFFSAGALPEKTSPGTRKRITEYLGEKNIDYRW